MVAINQKLRDGFIRHGVRLVGYENGVANRVAEIWAEGARESADIVESRGRNVRLVDKKLLLEDLAGLTSVLIEETETLLKIALLEQAQTEQRAITRMLWKAFPISVLENVGGLRTLTEAAGPISPELLRPIKLTTAHRLVNSPIHGKAWPARVKGLNGAMAGKLRRQLSLGMAHGESVPKISRRVRNAFKGVGGRRAALIARTEIHNVSNRVHDEMFKKNRKLLNGAEYTSTLDARTCPVCGSYDRNSYFFDGKPSFASRPFIPQHPKCRCVYIPVTKFKEIFGFDIKPGRRASMFGPVKADANFGQWLKRQPVGIAEQVLGKAKARLFHDGVFQFDQFVNRGRVLNLKQLEGLKPVPTPPSTLSTRVDETLKKPGFDREDLNIDTFTQKEFAEIPNFVTREEMDLLGGGGMTGSQFSKMDQLLQADTREWILAAAKKGQRRLDAFITVPEVSELKAFRTMKRFVLPEPKSYSFGVNDSFWQKIKASGKVDFRGARHMATNPSRAMNYAGSDGGAVFYFDAPKGTRVLHARVFDLDEAILQPGSKFRFLNVQEKIHNGRKISFVRVELIDDGTAYTKKILDFVDEVHDTLNIPKVAARTIAPKMPVNEAYEKYHMCGMFEGKGPPTAVEWKRAMKAMEKVPQSMHNQILAQKRGIDLVKNHGVTIHPDMAKFKGLKVSKYKDKTFTWDDVRGCGPAIKSTDNAIITINKLKGIEARDVILHEHAHLYDSVMGGISKDPRWQAVWRTEMSKMHWTTYYSKDYADEAFAECYARYFASKKSRLMLTSKTRKYFDDMVALAKRARKPVKPIGVKVMKTAKPVPAPFVRPPTPKPKIALPPEQEWRRKFANKVYKKGSATEKAALNDWTFEGDYRELNRRLRSGSKLKAYKPIDKGLRSLLKKSVLDHDVKTYRGFRLRDDHSLMKALKRGKAEGLIIQDQGFASVSLQEKVAKRFIKMSPKELKRKSKYRTKPILAEIELPKGTHALGTLATNVEELILPPEMKLKVMGMTKKGETFHLKLKVMK